jgi:hypothetical protein
MLKMIASMESQLNEMKIALGAEPGMVTVKPSKRTKKEKDPNAPAKEPNVWIKFTQRVSALLKAAEIDTGAAPVSKQFASSLKDEKPYGDWTDAQILAAWPKWTRPAESKMKIKSRMSESGSVSGSSVAAPAPTPEPVKPVELVKPVEPVKPVKPVEAAKPGTVKKAGKQVKKPTFTLEQLQDFGEIDELGGDFGVNVRGDTVDGFGDYVGFWDGKKLVKKSEKPDDWDTVMPGSA